MDPSEAAGAAAGGGLVLIIQIGIAIAMIAGMWKIFTKAGQPGWAAIVPIYNTYVLLTIAGKPGWWLILMFIPIANIVVGILAMIGLASKFGKGGGFVAGLILLPLVFCPILGFGGAQYGGAPTPEPAQA
jgi:hypothetical protein